MRTSAFARIVRSFCIAAALGILLVASSTPAGATGTPDQSQEAQTELNGVPLVGSQLAAQTFTAGRQGALDQVDLLLTRYETPGNLTIEIRTTSAGVPTSQVIASGSVVDTSPGYRPVHIRVGVGGLESGCCPQHRDAICDRRP